MSQVIYTKDTIDAESGELIQKEIYRKQVGTVAQFVKLFISDVSKLARCSGAEQSFMNCISKYLEYNTNEFILNKDRREDIMHCGGISKNTLNSAITRLVKKALIIRKSENTYIMNPKIFFSGAEIERAKVIETITRYEIGEQLESEDNGCDC